MHTFGNTQLKLIAQGYIAASVSGSLSHRAADEPAAILLIPSYGNGSSGVPDAGTRNVGALTISVRDTAARAAVLKIFAKHGLDGKSPHRVDSAKNLTFIFALSAYELPCAQQSEPFYGEYAAAVSLDTFARIGAAGFPESYVVAVAGEWVNGSPLEIPRSKLPTADIDAIFREVEALLSGAKPAYEPPQLPPELAAKVAARRKLLERQKAELAERNDSEILAAVERRRARLNPLEPWNTPTQDERELETIRLYDVIVGERKEAADRVALLAKHGLSA